MSRPFNLAAAQRGEPIERLYDGKWEQCFFVGLDIHGEPVVNSVRDIVCRNDAERLRMAPKKVTVRYRVALFKRTNGEFWTYTVDNPEEEDQYSKDPKFRAWLTEWQTAEVPQGGE